MSVMKINLLDRRWAVRLQDQLSKIDRQLANVEQKLSPHARMMPVATNLRKIQMARKELASVAAFAHMTKQILSN